MTDLLSTNETQHKLRDKCRYGCGFRVGSISRRRQLLYCAIHAFTNKRVRAVKQHQRLNVTTWPLLLQLQCHLHGNACSKRVASQSNCTGRIDCIHSLHKVPRHACRVTSNRQKFYIISDSSVMLHIHDVSC